MADSTNGNKPKVALVGHCGPDSSYLRMAISKALPGATVLAADDDAELMELAKGGVDLLLLNRQLDYGFRDSFGVETIRRLKPQFPHIQFMLVSNYADAQAEAEAAGAVPGFGKREIGTPRVTQLLRDALNASSPR